MPASTPKLTKEQERKIVEKALEQFKIASDAESFRDDHLDDKKFAAGDQWPDEIKRLRETDKRPTLTINRLKPQIKQVTNQQRAMRPSVQVNPVDSGADPDTAEVLQGVIRHIETSSDADDAYDQAGKDQVVMGRGFIRIVTEYESDKSLNQVIKFERVRRPETIYFAPCEKLDYSDARYAFELFDLSYDEYEERFPKATSAKGLWDMVSAGDCPPEWIRDDSIRVAKYWSVEVERKELQAGGKSRIVESRAIKCYMINAVEVLETYEWVGKYIPLIPVIGEEIVIEGKVDYRGMVRDAKDPQRMFNFWKSATTEMVALAPRAPFVAAEGQLEPYQKQWKQANTRNIPYLLYKATSLDGRLVPPPQRNVAEPPIQALMLSSQSAENDLRAATGFYDVGERETREQSGRAIMARQKQGELGNSDFLDGLARAIRHCGRILIDLIPKIYDVPRVIRIIGGDNQPKAVMVHAGGQVPPELPEGIKGAYDLSAGTYDVTVTVGPSFQSARQEFVETMAQMFAGNPQLWQVIGDLFFENTDIPNRKQIAERLRKLLPPQLQDKENQQDPAVLQAQLQQAGQQMQQMAAALQEAQQQLESKQLEVESNERIKQQELELKAQIETAKIELERMKAENEVQIAQIKLQADLQKQAIQAETARMQQDSEIQRDRERQTVDLEHQRESSADERMHAERMAAHKAQSAD